MVAYSTMVETLDGLDVVKRDLEEWDTEPMNIEVATSKEDNPLTVINFTDTIGHRKQVPKEAKCNNTTCYWLNDEWNQNSKKIYPNKVTPYFVGVAHSGFNRNPGKWFLRARSHPNPKNPTYVGIATLVHITMMVNGQQRPWKPLPPCRDPPAQNHGCHDNIWSDPATPPTQTA